MQSFTQGITLIFLKSSVYTFTWLTYTYTYREKICGMLRGLSLDDNIMEFHSHLDMIFSIFLIIICKNNCQK